MLPALIALGLHLISGPGAAAAPSAQGTATTLATADMCGSPQAGACTGQRPTAITPASITSAGISPAGISPGGPQAPTVRTHTLVARPTPSAAPSASRSASGPSPSPATSASVNPSPSATPASPAATPVGQVLAVINAARSAAGLPALTISVALDRTASAHNALMAGGCGLSHQCPGEPNLGARETAAGVYWTAAGENIGEGGPVAVTTAAITQMAVTLTQDMLNEQPPNDGHRKNILSTSFAHIGIAVNRDSSGTVWLTQDFSS
jgi:uncharacterized protein YkwD